MSGSAHLVAVLLQEFDFLLREGRHGDGLDSVRWVKSSPAGGRGGGGRERESH